MQLRQLVKLYRAFADTTRLRIINLLVDHPGLNVNAIAESLQLPQSTVSRQLALLRSAALVDDEREGRWVRYYISAGPMLGASELPGTVKQARAACPDLRADLKRVAAVLRAR